MLKWKCVVCIILCMASFPQYDTCVTQLAYLYVAVIHSCFLLPSIPIYYSLNSHSTCDGHLGYSQFGAMTVLLLQAF